MQATLVKDSRGWMFACMLGDLETACRLASELAIEDAGRLYALAHMLYLKSLSAHPDLEAEKEAIKSDMLECLRIYPYHFRAATRLQRVDSASEELAVLLKDTDGASSGSSAKEWLLLSDRDVVAAATLRRDAVEARLAALSERNDLKLVLDLVTTLSKQRPVKDVAGENERLALDTAVKLCSDKPLENVYLTWITVCESRLALDDVIRVGAEKQMLETFKSETGDVDNADFAFAVKACEAKFPHIASRSLKGRSKLKLLKA